MKIDPDAPAFPSHDDVPGITVRAYIATQILSSSPEFGLRDTGRIVEMADALIAELNKADCDPQAAEAIKSADAITVELDRIIELAEWGIASERLSGNVVKEEFWRGQKSAAEQIKLWLESQ